MDIPMLDIPDSPPHTSSTIPTIPQKRPSAPTTTDDADALLPSRSKQPREKKDSWKKKEASAAAAAAAASNTALTTAGSSTSTNAAAATGTASGKHTTGHNTPGGGAGGMGANAASWPTLNRWRLPPPKEQDYFGHRAPPMMSVTEIPDLPEEFYVVNDQSVPLGMILCNWSTERLTD